ncbi:hypothetical protein G9A89_012981 [Geosiphon pyriformis]|nr:hypothetical protein G9A89_012981 [Geosiphon pyriformis]
MEETKSSLPSTKVLLVGAGAIGAIYSWRLQVANCHITAVCRSNYERVRTQGFEIYSTKFGDLNYRPDIVTRTVTEAVTESSPFDFVIVCTKVLPNIFDVTELIRPAIISSKTTIVLIQNGVGIEIPVATQFPQNILLSIVTWIGVGQLDIGVIHQRGPEFTKISYFHDKNQGEAQWSKEEKEEMANTLASFFKAGGVQIDVVDDIQAARWEKLVWNASWSAISVTSGGNDTHTLLKDSLTVELIKLTMGDVLKVAKADGYELPDSLIDRYVELTRKLEGGHKPSMLLDCERGNPMEIEAILGNPVQIAKEKGIEVPYLQTLYTLLKLIDEKNMRNKIK